ncbi:MAG: hypothetical protein DHS20C21_07610 [Gemmatimonadota bacterium]|nr:MAG: hypothetical protein DHS20C21_07610 [Gemmatimonadota bacterium]
MRSPRRLLLCLAWLTALTPDAALGITKIEGEYQVQLDIRKQDRFFPWDYDFNNDDSFGLVQFRIFSQPHPSAETYIKFEEDWNRGGNSGFRPEFQFREAHARYRYERDGHGFDTYLFSRQDRFWVENHLIEVVRGDNLKDSDNAQGIRTDVFGYLDTDFTYIYSDFSSQSNPSTVDDPGSPAGTDDAHIFRARRSFLDRTIRAGLTYNRRVESEDAFRENGHTEVFAGDFRYTWGSRDFRFEYAESQLSRIDRADSIQIPGGDPYFPEDGQFDSPTIGEFFQPHRWFPSDATFKAELRSVSVGTPTFGYYNVAPFYYYAGPDYSNPLGDGLSDERGYWINSWYLLPERAITISANYGRWKKEIFEQKDITELYTEIYTEYVNGFTTKLFHRRKTTRDFAIPGVTEITRNHDFFAEVQVESRLAWLRIQGKIKDFDTENQKELASLETSVNISRTVKMYNRFTFGNDPARLRESFFAELQYRPRPGMEVFLSYGPWWIGDSDNPVDDGDLEGGAQNKDIVKFTLKGYF